MLNYVFRRVLYAAPIAIGVTLLVFALLHIAPGDPINAVAGPDAPADVVEALRRAYGFDKPLPVQYLLYLHRILSGDLGVSVATGRPVSGELAAAFVNTLVLALGAALMGFVAGVALGAAAGWRKGSLTDRLATLVSLIGVSIPHYWFGMVLVILLAVEARWLPAMGMGTGTGAGMGDLAVHAFLPALTMAVIPTGIVARTVRAAVGETLEREFVQALRAKGLRRGAIMRHVARNVSPTLIAVLGLQFGYLLGGSILIETVFAWPGAGFLLNEAIFKRDLPVLQGLLLMLAMFFVLLNLAVDVIQAWLDPRMRRA